MVGYLHLITNAADPYLFSRQFSEVLPKELLSTVEIFSGHARAKQPRVPAAVKEAL
jgi:hypothetical protein